MGSDNRPAAGAKRFFRLAGMTAAVAGSYAKSRIKSAFKSNAGAATEMTSSHIANGERIARTLSELKGAAMKVGQMASIASDVLPDELTNALKVLQKEAPPMPYNLIAEQIERELGSPPERLYAHFEEKPFAAASIGQVHRARSDDGREVVVKVQYPNVDKSCDSDLMQLKLAIRAAGLVKFSKHKLDEVFDEIQQRLHEELDYCNEADNVRLFRGLLKNHPYLRVPEVVGERSAQRVLTLSYEPGDTLEQVQNYPQEKRNRIGEHIAHMLCSQIFEHKVLHADPNPANFAFRPDGTIVIYDFGCISRLDGVMVATLRDIIREGLDENYSGVERALRGMDILNPSGPRVEYAFYKQVRDLIVHPLLEQREYDFAQSTIREEFIKRAAHFSKHMFSFQPQAKMVYIDRAIVGHYGILCQIGWRNAVIDFVQPYLEMPQVDYSV